MTFTAPGFRGIQELRYGATGQVLRLAAEANGAVVSVSGTPTYAVYLSGGDTSIASGNASFSTPNLSVTLDLSNTSTFPLDRFYRCVITFTDGTTTYVREVLFDVVRYPTSDDSPCRLDDLRGMHVRIDAALTQLSQNSDGHSRYITPAWDELRLFLEAQGIYPTAVNRVALVTVLRKMAAVNIMRGLMQSPGDVYATLAEKFEEEAKEAKQHLVVIGRDGDGLTVTETRAVSQPSLTIGPDRGVIQHARLNWKPVAL